MVVNGRPLKRMKRRITADLYDFFTFPAPAAADSPGPFRANVRGFLSRHASVLPSPPVSGHLMAWQVLFRAGDLTDGPVCLDVVEEDVARSRSVFCDQCRVVGWSDHPVCGKRYHFIIKADRTPPVGMRCGSCGGGGASDSISRCNSCNREVPDWIYHPLEDTASTHHLLHGVVHANGFGHLLRVNGREGGSRVLSGCQIMDFWDRLCKMLRVRKVSVMDVSKKLGLEYRLLHAVIKGKPWYGNWGYEFGAGSFGVGRDAYAAAIHTLSALPLSALISQGNRRLQDTLALYRSLSEKHRLELVNIRDLFSFLMSLIQKARKASSTGASYGAACAIRDPAPDPAVPSRLWTKVEVERVEEAMLKVLMAVSGSKWVTSRALRAAVWRLGSPKLLDHCLKDLAGKTTSAGMVVTARTDPGASCAPEYRLAPGSPATSGSIRVPSCPSLDKLLWDLVYLYESTLHPNTMSLSDGVDPVNGATAAAAAQRLLDCKKFVKDYEKEKLYSGATGGVLALSCQVELAEQAEVINAAPPPPEIITLGPEATVSDLKFEATRAFQDVYLMFRGFQAEELIGYSGVDDSTLVKLLLPGEPADSVVRIRGRCTGKSGLSRYRMERGDENWTVDCRCGARDDDGERMMACDICSVWQHTRCSGIPDSASVPVSFICCRCRRSAPTIKEEDDGGESLCCLK